MKVRIVNKSNNAIPNYATRGSAGVDIRSNYENYILEPGERKMIETGLYLEIPFGYEAQVRPRSGSAFQHGITVLNSPGTIDSDYRGEVGIILINHGSSPFTVSKGDRIAQLVFTRHEKADFVEVDELTETARGDGAYGSTGIK